MTQATQSPRFALAPAPAAVSEVPIGRSLRGTAVVVLATAVLAVASLQSRAGGVAATAMVLVLCWGLWRIGWVVRPGGRALLGVAAALSPLLLLRSSPWLVVANLATIAVVMALACTSTSGARWFDVSAASALRRLGSATITMLGAAPAAARLGRSLARDSSATHARTWSSMLRGLGIAAPIVVILGLSLASADAVFASLFDVGVDAPAVVWHVAVLVLAAVVATGWFVQASRPPAAPVAATSRVGAVEALVVVAALDAVYLVYAASQLLVARRGPAYVLEQTGLSYAEYARSGFFQLLWVAAATALVLAVLRGSTRPASRAVGRGLTAAGTLASALTLVVVHAALVRLDLYQQAFGLTLLRVRELRVRVVAGGRVRAHRRVVRRPPPQHPAVAADGDRSQRTGRDRRDQRGRPRSDGGRAQRRTRRTGGTVRRRLPAAALRRRHPGTGGWSGPGSAVRRPPAGGGAVWTRARAAERLVGVRPARRRRHRAAVRLTNRPVR